MRGVRFAIDGYQDIFSQTLQTHFGTLNTPFTGRSSLLPPNESHLLGNFTSVLIPHMGFNHYWYTGGASSTTEVETTHYRVWIGGVDKTGIVALGSPFAHNYAAGTIGLPGQTFPHRRVGGYLSASVPSGSYKSQTVWFDIWVTVKTYNAAWYLGGSASSPGSYEPVCQVDTNALLNRAVFKRANVNAKRYVGDAYRFTFPDNGPGGQSTLSATTGSGWTATPTNAGLSFNHATHGIVSLNWSTESPVLTCTLYSKINSPLGSGASMRYLPAPSTPYRHRNQNGSVISYGCWNPQGSTTFQQVSREAGNTFLVKGSSNAPSSLFTGFPSTITVEKI